MTSTDFLKLYDEKQRFHEDILRQFYFNNYKFDDEIGEIIDIYQGENRRWSYLETYYVKIRDRYFSFTRDIGLTEYQENDYDFQPEEVTYTEETRMIVEKIWHAKEHN